MADLGQLHCSERGGGGGQSSRRGDKGLSCAMLQAVAMTAAWEETSAADHLCSKRAHKTCALSGSQTGPNGCGLSARAVSYVTKHACCPEAHAALGSQQQMPWAADTVHVRHYGVPEAGHGTMLL